MDVYDDIKAHYQDDARVEVNHGKGAQGIKLLVKGKPKMFVMFSKGSLLVQSSADHVDQLIKQGIGQEYDPGTGKIMPDRVLISAQFKDRWVNIVEDAISQLQP